MSGDSEPRSEAALHGLKTAGAREDGGYDGDVGDVDEDVEVKMEGEKEGGEERGVWRVLVVVRAEECGGRT